MKIEVTNHAKIRWYERFVNNGNIDGDQIAEEIRYDFGSAKLDKQQTDTVAIYKSEKTYFVVDETLEDEKVIITVYPVNEESEEYLFKTKKDTTIEELEDILEKDESFEVRVYKKVLEGELDKFPLNFWKEDIGGNSYIGAKECTIYMYKYIGWSYSDIINESDKSVFRDNKLGGMISTLFNNSWHMAIYNAYPEIKPYMLKKSGRIEEYWKQDGIERAKEFGVWLKEELSHKGYKFTSKNVLSIKWAKIFKEYKMQSLIKIVFDNDLVQFFNTVFGSNINEIDLMRYEMQNSINRFDGLQM